MNTDTEDLVEVFKVAVVDGTFEHRHRGGSR